MRISAMHIYTFEETVRAIKREGSLGDRICRISSKLRRGFVFLLTTSTLWEGRAALNPHPASDSATSGARLAQWRQRLKGTGILAAGHSAPVRRNSARRSPPRWAHQGRRLREQEPAFLNAFRRTRPSADEDSKVSCLSTLRECRRGRHLLTLPCRHRASLSELGGPNAIESIVLHGLSVRDR